MLLDEWWESDQLDEFSINFVWVSWPGESSWSSIEKKGLWAYFSNRQSKNLASKIIKRHYDIGNDLYRSMLAKHLAYSCGYWKNAKTLDQAQEHKFDPIFIQIIASNRGIMLFFRSFQ